MNIFVLDKSPVVSAQMMNDKHVVKMILESAQILSTVIRNHGGNPTYKSTHAKHPCTLWAEKSKENFNWLYEHGLALCEEYTLRYSKEHKCLQYYLTEYTCPDTIESIGLTEFPQAMPDEYKDENPIKAYRKYYLGAKKHFSKWTNREVPLWFQYENVELDV